MTDLSDVFIEVLVKELDISVEFHITAPESTQLSAIKLVKSLVEERLLKERCNG